MTSSTGPAQTNPEPPDRGGGHEAERAPSGSHWIKCQGTLAYEK